MGCRHRRHWQQQWLEMRYQLLGLRRKGNCSGTKAAAAAVEQQIGSARSHRIVASFRISFHRIAAAVVVDCIDFIAIIVARIAAIGLDLDCFADPRVMGNRFDSDY